MTNQPKDVEERLGAVFNELTETVIELVEENEPELTFQAVRLEIANTFSFELATYTDKRVREVVAPYNELIQAVESKFDGETRHQTALRYIQQAEKKPTQASSNQPQDL